MGFCVRRRDLAPLDTRQVASASDQQKAQVAHTAESVGVGALPRPRLGGGNRPELEAAEEIVGKDTQVLPGAVGP